MEIFLPLPVGQKYRSIKRLLPREILDVEAGSIVRCATVKLTGSAIPCRHR
jgi:hypothetical protein